MSEENKHTDTATEHPNDGAEDAKAQGASRRTVIKTAALVAPVLMTVTSRSALAATQCTYSGWLSGNLSGPQVGCEGCTPGYWKQPQHFHNWQPPYYPKDGNGHTATKWTDHFPPLPAMGSGGAISPDLTLLEALKLHGNTHDEALARHAVAALLNGAYQRATGGMNFGYTDGEIIDYYNQLYNDPTVSLEDMKNIFEALNERGCPL